MKNLSIIFLMLLLTLPAFAGEVGRFGLGINYGLVNNIKIWNTQSSEAGSMLRVDYTYDFNDFYTAALEIGFFADENIFRSASTPTFTQTIASLNIDHIFRARTIGLFSQYYKIGTLLYGANLWRKSGNSYLHESTDVSADISAGIGAEFKLWNSIANVDLTFPALIHIACFSNRKVAYVLSLGWKRYF